MAKSLTETAKAILKEGAIPSVSASDTNPDRDTKASNPNRATLRPGSRYAEMKPFANPGAMAPSAPDNQVQDLGPALVKQGDVPPSAKASGVTAKDTSRSSQSGSNRPDAEKFGVDSEKKQDRKSKEIMEEDVEISEELESFIKEMLEQGLSEEQIAQAIEENFELVEAKHEKEDEKVEDEKEDEDEDKKEDKKEDMKETFEVDMSEHIEALFQGEELSEDFRNKAKTIFEAAVREKVEAEVARIQEAYSETLNEQVEEITETLSANVDDYLNYVVEQWVNENEVAVESGLRTELTEEFISGLRQLFAENYIDIPEDKISVVEELGTKVEDLEKKLNEEIERNVQLKKSLNESKRFEILVNAVDGLTDTQAEKLKSLAEGVEFTTSDEFNTKVKTLRENYFPTNIKSENVLDKAETDNTNKAKVLNEDSNSPMAAYVRTLGRKLPN